MRKGNGMVDSKRCITKGSVLRNENYHSLSICLWEWSTRRGELMQSGKATIEAVESSRRNVSQGWAAIDRGVRISRTDA